MPPKHIFEVIPTLEDFERSLTYHDWQQELADLPVDDRSFMDSLVPVKRGLDAALAASDDNAAAACALPWIIGYSINSSDLSSHRAILENLKVEQITYLINLVPLIPDPDLQARIAYFLFKQHKSSGMGPIAVKGYLKAAKSVTPANWPIKVKLFGRALYVALSLGKRNSAREEVLQAIDEELELNIGDATYFTHGILRTLLKQKQRRSTLRWAQLAAEAGKAAEIKEDWHRATDYWELCSQWYVIAGSHEEANKALWTLGEIHVRHAESILATPDRFGPHLHAKTWFERAVQAFRRIPGSLSQERVKEVHLRLLESQRTAVTELIPHSSSVDVTDTVNAVRQAIQGLPFIEALSQLATCYVPSDPKVLYRRSRKIHRGLLSEQFFPTVLISSTGMTTANQSGHREDARAAKKAQRRASMLQDSEFGRLVVVQSIVLPAIWQMNQDHDVTEIDFIEIVRLCPFIQQEQEEIYVKAFAAGFQQDWLIVGHLLIPQLENSLRQLVLAFGANPPDAVLNGEREWGVQEFLFDPQCITILEKYLGRNILWDVRTVLCEKFGANLRPLVTHGMLSSWDFGNSQFSNNFVYLWWLSLHICFHCISRLKRSTRPNAHIMDD